MKMFKKMIVMMIAGLLLTGCSMNGGKSNNYQGPSKVAYDFVSGFRELDAKKMGNQLALEEEKPDQEKLDRNFRGVEMNEVRAALAQFIPGEIKISNEKIDGDYAVVDVTIKIPNLDDMKEEYTFDEQGSRKGKEVFTGLKRILKEVKFDETTQALYLEKVGSKWKVSSMNSQNEDFSELIEIMLHQLFWLMSSK